MTSADHEKVRFGLVGTGRGTKFARIVGRLPGTELVSVLDPDPESRAIFLEEFPDTRTVEHFEDLLDGSVDAVFLASPQQYHGPQAVAALGAGVHVLSEIPPVVSVEQARELVGAVRRSSATFMVAENHCYIPSNLVVTEMVRAGLFGDIHFAEGEYLYEVRDMQLDGHGRPNWRSFWHVGKNGITYPTHSLGPLLQWLDTRLDSVMTVGAGHSTSHEMDDTLFLVGKTVKDAVVTMRLDLLSYRPAETAFVAFQGSAGAYDSGRGPSDAPRVYLHGRTPGRVWEPLDQYVDEFRPRRYAALFEEAKLWKSPYGPLLDFVDAITRGTTPSFDVYRGLDMMLPGVVSETARAQGTWTSVPNPRFFTDGIGVAAGRDWPLA
ncbi:Gfo/Idh/MocA family oxidoreductase [Cellulomonas fimi]|uniref:Gfo/Idh/MocA family protein n=1 Tax=Cellulomonas fimi TaxID=1708 RepID=UPI00234D5DB8|nr:Gfo/Idh/MocA family oxidoreductase [Cellulomonas fimi]MDC7121765.1 Gfo/Idh/MocA family oxidoreductase [Cellulomonas fimi]